MMRSQRGFTLTEAMLYIGISSMVILALSSFFLWTNSSNTKTKVLKEVLNNSRIAMETMSYEIKQAESVYSPTSAFSTSSGQLSLETSNYAQDKEETSYIDFFICDQKLCLKKENESPVIVTSDNVEVTGLAFNQVATSSVEIALRIDYIAPSGKPEYQSFIVATSTVSMRNP